jgi:hypothetical protein
MKFEDFISKNLMRIINDAKKAQIYFKEDDSLICRILFRRVKSIGDSYYNEQTNFVVQIVDFDVSVITKAQGKS